MNRLKKHESPRKQGRNSKGKAASARLRQLKKRDKMLVAKYKKRKNKEE